ncbi:MAG: MotA/TolQ/ExbB proton channel family protein [Phycisphaerales bacterium]|nr:MAG: MotA/TolQ/ExbB proton channel family protein [Phycisphaerales bacterium]
MFAKPLIELFSEGGPVMIAIAGVSVLAWYLALRTWWQSRYQLAWLERMKSDARVASSGTSTDLHVQFIVRAQAARLEHAVWAMGAFATMLPLLGLLGTVLGMLVSFEVIQIHGTGQPRLLAGGIGQALMTTQAGLFTAVPVLFFHHVIRNRVRLIRSEMEMLPQTGPTGDRERKQ